MKNWIGFGFGLTADGTARWWRQAGKQSVDNSLPDVDPTTLDAAVRASLRRDDQPGPMHLFGPRDAGSLRALTALLDQLGTADIREDTKGVVPTPTEPLLVLVDESDPSFRQLPLEAAAWRGEGVAVANQDVTLLVRRSRGGRPLAPDSKVHALVVLREQSTCPPADLQRMRALDGDHITLTVLTQPSWDELNVHLSKHSDYNLFAYVGHVHIDAGTAGTSDRGETFFTFRGYTAGLPGSAQTGNKGCVTPDELATLLDDRLRHFRAAVLLGCQTWPLPSDPFIRCGVPVVAGMQFRVQEDGPARVALCGFLSSLAGTGRVDRAFLALRHAFAGAAGGPHHAVWPVLHLNGESVEFVAQDETLLAKIAYARNLVSDDHELKYLPSLGGTAGEGAPRATCYFGRVVQYQVEKKVDEAKAASGQRTELIPHDEKEEWLRERLMSAAGGLHLGVKAQGGTGKSALLREVAFYLAEHFLRNPTAPNARLPVLIELGGLKGNEREMPADKLAEARVRSKVFPKLSDAPVTFTDYVFLFDGLDEMTWRADKEAKSAWGHLAFGGQRLQPARTVVASRPEAVAAYELPHFKEENANRPNILDLRPLVYPAEVETLTDRLCGDTGQRERVMTTVGRSPSLQAAVTLPFYLRLLCDLAGGPAAELPDTATRVLDAAIRRLVMRRNQKIGEDAAQLHEAHLPLLAAVAFAEMTAGELQTLQAEMVIEKSLEAPFTSGVTVWKALKLGLPKNEDGITDLRPLIPRNLLPYLVRLTGLLIADDATVKFHDPRVRTFLAAKHLADLLTSYKLDDTAPIPWGDARTIKEVVLAAAGRREWRRVLVHLAGLLDREDRLTWLLGELARHEKDTSDENKPAAFNMTLGLACRCCGELSQQKQLTRDGVPRADVRQAVNEVAWRAWQVVEPLNALQMSISPVARQIGHLVNAEAKLAVTGEATASQVVGPAGPAAEERLLLDLILDRVERADETAAK